MKILPRRSVMWSFLSLGLLLAAQPDTANSQTFSQKILTDRAPSSCTTADNLQVISEEVLQAVSTVNVYSADDFRYDAQGRPIFDLVPAGDGQWQGLPSKKIIVSGDTEGADCPEGICPPSFVVAQPFQINYNQGSCSQVVPIEAGTSVALELVDHFYFPFNGDNYCGCQYIGEAELPEPCMVGGEEITSIVFRVRVVDMHFHLRDDDYCEYHDNTNMKSGGAHVDETFQDELYYGHPELVAKMQSYWHNEFSMTQIRALCEPRFELVRDRTSPRGCFPLERKFIDANLALLDPDDPEPKDIRELTPEELLALDANRKGVATDGVSSIVVRLEFEEEGRIEQLDFEGDIEMPWSDRTFLFEDKHYVFILFTPPDEFLPKDKETYLLNEKVEAWDLEFTFDFVGAKETTSLSRTVPLVRPPVVLLHDVYTDPVTAWKTPAEGGTSMFDYLTENGFQVFATDYTESNGSTGSSENSSFAANTKVLWGDVYPSNTDGIKDALTFYRNTLGVATTQADVIGHGMGGVLARVYASEHYNDTYKRPENFMKGDINRLVTIAAPHYGSHLAELQIFIEDLTLFDIGSLQDWILASAVSFVTKWAGGAAPSEAIRDLRPQPDGEALEVIGAAEVPSHAITCRAESGELLDGLYDPDKSFYDLYWYITTLMYQADNVLEAYLDSKLALIDMGLQASTTLDGGDPGVLYKGISNLILYKKMVQDGIHNAGMLISALEGDLTLQSQVNIFKYAFGDAGMGDLFDPLLDIFVFGADPVGVAAGYFVPFVEFSSPLDIILNQLQVNESSMEGLRALIFNNDDNDGVVRVQSQSGELEKVCASCVTNMDKILHDFAPQYPEVQLRVSNLLAGNMENFHAMGFPSSDNAQKIYYPEERLELFKVPLRDDAAICQSGMQPAHARAFARIADEQNVIIMTRPVNPDGTPLIGNDAATKSMDIKPKSGNWGPQKGYLPIEQRYSKLTKMFSGMEREQKISEYTAKAYANIDDGLAQARALQVEACNGWFNVMIDLNKKMGEMDEKAEDEIVLMPLDDPSKVCFWGKEFHSYEYILDCKSLSSEFNLVPLEVMASPTEIEPETDLGRYLTADYDLLMVGFYEGPDQGNPNPPVLDFEPGVGQITPQQLGLLDLLNQAVAETGYEGGKVVHHGPENQFQNSPYIDYPITVFAPDDIPNGFLQPNGNGLILSIEMGPLGFRDINLKQFVNKMRKEGYDLYHNPNAPGWQWTWDEMAELYIMEDSPTLPGYVEQLPFKYCNKHGGQVEGPCPGLIKPIDEDQVVPYSWLFGWRNSNTSISSTLSPNPVYGSEVTLTLDLDSETDFTWYILDAFGQNVMDQYQEDAFGKTDIQFDVDHLPTGVYTVLTDAFGAVGRFVKL